MKTSYSQAALQAVASECCPLGPVPALADALGHISGDWRLVCLADVFFATEPFSAFIQSSGHHGSIDGCLLTGTDLMSREVTGSGAVMCVGAIVRAVSYRLSDLQETTRARSRRWSGSYFFRESLASKLQAQRTAYQLAPFENWIQGSLEEGAVCSWSDAGEFVNVNSAQDYEVLTGLCGMEVSTPRKSPATDSTRLAAAKRIRATRP